jgi:hypothetical protein
MKDIPILDCSIVDRLYTDTTKSEKRTTTTRTAFYHCKNKKTQIFA